MAAAGGTRAVAAAFLPASFGCPEESSIEVLEFEAEDECSSSSGSLTGGGFEALNGDCGFSGKVSGNPSLHSNSI